MATLIALLIRLIDLYVYVILASVLMSWLVTFGVVNYNNPFVRTLASALYAVTEPALRIVRRFVPNIGMIDISPIILLLGCWVVQSLLGSLLYQLA
jgi:YggT family protein